MVDYKEVLLTLVPVAPRTQHLCSFLCELSLLHTSLSVYAPARLASAALLLARLMHGQSKRGPPGHCGMGVPGAWETSQVGEVRRAGNITSSSILEKKAQQNGPRTVGGGGVRWFQLKQCIVSTMLTLYGAILGCFSLVWLFCFSHLYLTYMCTYVHTQCHGMNVAAGGMNGLRELVLSFYHVASF